MPRYPSNPADRRAHPRFKAVGISASIKVKGQFGLLTADALDFNRHGMGIVLERAVAKNKSLLITTAEFWICKRFGMKWKATTMRRSFNCLRLQRSLTRC